MHDVVIRNAMIWTAEDQAPRRADLRVSRGRVESIGEGVAGDHSDWDACGRVVTPGFVDAHLHLTLGAETFLQLDLSCVTGRDEFESMIEQAHATLPPDAWLIASGWDQTKWEGQPMPDRHWLDAAGSRPVVCWRCDWHAAVVNDAVLSLIGRDVTVPKGGEMPLGMDGFPTGLMVEAAAWHVVNPLIPQPALSRRREAMSHAIEALLKSGITGVRTMEYQKDLAPLLLPALEGAPLRCSVVALDRSLPRSFDWISEMPCTDQFRVTGAKSFFDGTLGSRTARLREPYADAPETCGQWLEHAAHDEIDHWLSLVRRSNLRPVIHAIGDAAVCRALEATADVNDATIEHVEIVPLENLECLAGRMLSVQPTHRAEDAMMASSRLGRRASSLLPLRQMQNAGGTLAFGTDWPIVPFDPMTTMKAAVTGCDREGTPFYESEALDLASAFRAATVHANVASGLTGGLAVGGPADFLVWEGDPFQSLDTASVQATFIDGKLVAGAIEGVGHV